MSIKASMYEYFGIHTKYIHDKETTSASQYLKDLEVRNIFITENEILAKYQGAKGYRDVCKYFYELIKEQWKPLDAKKDDIFNPDLFEYYVKKIIEKHYDIKTLPDISYIEDSMLYVDEECPNEDIHEEFVSIVNRVIACGKKHKIRLLKDLFEYDDFNCFMKNHIKKCHRHNKDFKTLMKAYYDAFDDADQSIYHLKWYDSLFKR